jgi:hypothetical protein
LGSADPFKANAYIDQDDAASVAKRARQIRIRISQMGLVSKALRVKKAGENDGFLPGDKAWKKFPLQPTQITVISSCHLYFPRRLCGSQINSLIISSLAARQG